MILIALGANLASPAGPPAATLRAAVAEMPTHGVAVTALSRFYRSAPVPASDQPDFINAVAIVRSALEPKALLDALLAIERHFGRERRVRWAARSLDLDLLAYDDQVVHEAALTLPHPRLHERAFVLAPLCELAPAWRHPLLGLGACQFLAALDGDAITALGPTES
ncbi:MAG: 2-amino-4-hydroxy-6-hydroxymethyldihydropteridine diphosphokinase [Alphaproteobacteria bacterium]|nr:2-amino-4-hydroxy-6-hydroxymethyldihydropteridine diphosphokinase [Alphaproteobacteria bacterium]